MLDDLFTLSQTFLKLRNRPFKRYFLRDPPLASRFSIIIGQRGVGKTTAMVQHILEACANDLYTPKALYLQADHFLVADRNLYGIAEEFCNLGGELLCLDELHKYPGWSRELKSIHDTFPRLKIVASGSSALEIAKGSHDLSRRAVVFRMHGMSFREFLGMRCGLELPSHSLEEIVSGHPRLADNVVTALDAKGLKVLALFREYLACGYYPYFSEFEDSALFYLTLEQQVHTTLESDLIAIHQSLTGVSIKKIRKLLSIIAALVPFTPDMKKLKSMLDIGDERTLKLYLQYLEDAGVILTVSRGGKGLKGFEKPEKIYLNNPNLFHALSPGGRPDPGALREAFFLCMLRPFHGATVANQGDFMVDGTHIFEIGGRSKGARQSRGVESSYLALDDMESGSGRKIPLWLFGFLY